MDKEAQLQELLQLVQSVKESGMDVSTLPPQLQELVASLKEAPAAAPSSGLPDDRIEITPEPFYVVKTTDDTGRKVFLNMCGHEAVPPPGNWEGGEPPAALKEALSNLGDDMPSDQAAALRIPLSLGEPVNELDKSGRPCSVYDIVLHLDVMRQSMTSPPLKVFVIQLAMSQLQQKYGVALHEKFKLPKMAYKGGIGDPPRPRPTCVRKDKGRSEDRRPLISEVEDDQPSFGLPIKPTRKKGPAAPQGDAPSAPGARGKGIVAAAGPSGQPLASGPAAGPRPLAHLVKSSIEFSERPVSACVARLHYPRDTLKDMDPASVSVRVVGGRALEVQAPGCSQARVEVPFYVDKRGVLADLDPSSDSIEVRLPYRALSDVLRELREAAPHALGTLGLASLEDELA